MNSLNRAFLLIYSILMNLLLFALSFAFYNPVFATNDDYRMSLIASGAYTGEPSATLVFVKYPIGLILSVLYGITKSVPWYGILTELFLFMPSVIFCYLIIKGLYEKKVPRFLGFIIYVIIYAFIIQKHVILPQFTLTSAFLSVACILLLSDLPIDGNHFRSIPGILFGIAAFCARMKVFLMTVPVIAIVIFIKILTDKEFKLSSYKQYFVALGLLGFLCAGIYAVDAYATGSPEYKDYKAFNYYRSMVYDRESIPVYDANRDFYDGAGIDMTLYYTITSRSIDFDPGVTTENFKKIVAYNNELISSRPIARRIFNAVAETFVNFFDTRIIYPSVFAFLLAIGTCAFAVNKRMIDVVAIILGIIAVFFLEMGYFCYIGRVLDRLTEVLLLVLTMVSLMLLIGLLEVWVNRRPKKVGGGLFAAIHAKFPQSVCLAGAAVFIICFAVSNQKSLTEKSVNQNHVNSRLSVLNAFAKGNPDYFYFYDPYDFIAASSDVFAVYPERLNTDSLGNWYINSPDNKRRNRLYGFDASVEGLTRGGRNVYYVAIGNLKNGCVTTLKERYDMEPVIVEIIPYINNNMNIYLFNSCR